MSDSFESRQMNSFCFKALSRRDSPTEGGDSDELALEEEEGRRAGDPSSAFAAAAAAAAAPPFAVDCVRLRDGVNCLDLSFWL